MDPRSILVLGALLTVTLVVANVCLSAYWEDRPLADQWLWAGAVTPTSFQVRVKGQGLLLVSLAEPVDGTHIFSQRLEGPGIHSVSVNGLVPETEYHYRLVVDPSQKAEPGRVRTPASGVQRILRVGVAACATVGSNHPVFDEIAQARFDLFLHMGDMHYHDIQTNDTRLYLDAFAQVHGAPRQQQLFRSTPVAYVWDDHDFGANNCNAFSPSAGAARAALQKAVPRAPVLGKPLAAYHAFSAGRTRFVMIDARSESVPGGELLSKSQLEWLLSEIATPGDHKLLVLMLGQPWIGEAEPGEDGWLGHPEDRQKVSEAIAASQAAGGYKNVLGVSGDAHMLAFDDGTHTDYSSTGGAGFPLLQAGPLDRSGSAKGGPYTSECMAYKLASNHQYGSLEITDDGSDNASAICVRFLMHRSGAGVLHEERMCGPLLGQGRGQARPCRIPLLPPREQLWCGIAICSFLGLLVWTCWWQVRSSGSRRRLGWFCVGAALLSLLPQVTLVVLQKKNQAPIDPPWRALLFQSMVQLVLLATLSLWTLTGSGEWRRPGQPADELELQDMIMIGKQRPQEDNDT